MLRLRVVATYATVAAVNATAGWLHLAGGESALGWAFILATLAFLLLGWEADGRLSHAREPRAADPHDPEHPPALFEPPAPSPQRAAGTGHPRATGAARRVAWVAGVAVVCGMELRLIAGVELATTLAVSGAIVAAGLGLPLLRLLTPPRRHTP